MTMILEVLAVFIFSTSIAILIALYFYLTRNFKFWHKLGIPYVKPTPFFRNLKESVFQKKNIGRILQEIYEENSDKPYVGIFAIDKPNLIIRDLELVKNVLVKDSQYFVDHVISVNAEVDPLFGYGLFLLKGQTWRQMRTNLNPVFTSSKMKMMFRLVDSCAKELAEYLDRAAVEGCTVDVTDIMYRYTTDVIASCAFGIDGNCLKDPQGEFRRYLKMVFDLSIRKALAMFGAFFAPHLNTVFNLKCVDDVINNYVRKTVWSTVEYREKHGVVRNDLLDCLIELRNKGKKTTRESIQSLNGMKESTSLEIDGDVFVSQAFFLLIASFETSGTTLSYVLYELAMNSEIQHRLRTEILSVLNRHNGQLTYDGIQEMSYLDMVVSETLRKHPPIPFLDRMCLSDYKLPAPSENGTIKLPAGTGVYISVLALHRDPTYYPEPEKFDPDRFTEENKRSRPNYTYMPFGEGPRQCIGMRFGLMQVKTALCHILSRYEVAPCKDTPVSLVYDTKSFILLVKGKLPLSFLRT